MHYVTITNRADREGCKQQQSNNYRFTLNWNWNGHLYIPRVVRQAGGSLQCLCNRQCSHAMR